MAPACVTVTVSPATVTVALRGEVVMFAATVTFTTATPCPADVLNVIHDAEL